MTKFFNIFKNPVFGPFLAHFPNFGGKKICLESPALVTHNFIWVSRSCQNLEKTNDTIPRKRPDRRKDGRKDGQILFHWTLPATAEGPIKLFNIE